MFTTRRIATLVPRTATTYTTTRLFGRTAPALVKNGDAVPDLDVLVEDSPGNKVNLAKEIKGKGIIIGTPAAFSMLLLGLGPFVAATAIAVALSCFALTG